MHLPSAHAHAPASSSAASLQWTRNPCFDQRQARRAATAVESAGKLLVASTAVAKRSYLPPVGMNTVALLKLASSALGLSPQRAMQVRLTVTVRVRAHPNPDPSPSPNPNPNPNPRWRRSCTPPA